MTRNSAEPDQSEGFSRGFLSHCLCARPRAIQHLGRREKRTAKQEHCRCDHPFGDGGIVGACCRADRYAASFTGF